MTGTPGRGSHRAAGAPRGDGRLDHGGNRSASATPRSATRDGSLVIAGVGASIVSERCGSGAPGDLLEWGGVI